MPIPIIFWAIGAAVAAAAAGAAGVAFAWEEPARGKKLTLIGPKQAGKTTWRTFLDKGVVPAGYVHTNITETLDKDVSLGELNLKVRVSDLSGSALPSGIGRSAPRLPTTSTSSLTSPNSLATTISMRLADLPDR